jgi:hypothetical protein
MARRATLGRSNLHTPSLRVAARHKEALERCGLTDKTWSKLATNHLSHQVSGSISFFHGEGKLQLGQFWKRKPLATLPLAFYFKFIFTVLNVIVIHSTRDCALAISIAFDFLCGVTLYVDRFLIRKGEDEPTRKRVPYEHVKSIRGNCNLH